MLNQTWKSNLYLVHLIFYFLKQFYYIFSSNLNFVDNHSILNSSSNLNQSKITFQACLFHSRVSPMFYWNVGFRKIHHPKLYWLVWLMLVWVYAMLKTLTVNLLFFLFFLIRHESLSHTRAPTGNLHEWRVGTSIFGPLRCYESSFWYGFQCCPVLRHQQMHWIHFLKASCYLEICLFFEVIW